MPSAELVAQPKSRWRKLQLLMVCSIILGSILTLAMGGVVKQETIRIVNGSDYVSSVYGEFNSRTTVGYKENFGGWSVGPKSESAQASIEAKSSSLIVDGSFLNASKPASVGVFKSAVVNIRSSPILEAGLNVTGATGYGLRFFSQYSNGTQFDVWWEGSLLDHRPAKGYEVIRANMQLQAFLATGQELETLTKFELYVEIRPNTALNFRLELLELNFLTEEVGRLGSSEGYKAVYIDLTTKPDESPSWYLNKIQIGANILANTGTTFTLHLVDGNTLYTTMQTPNSYAYSPLARTYNFAFYPEESGRTFSELLPKSRISIVLIANSGSFTEVKLDYLDFVFLPRAEQATEFSQQTRAFYYTYFVFFLFLLPLGLAILVYREFFGRQTFGTKALVLVLMAGLACRLALSPVTAHVFDMDIFLSSARAWFQNGTPRGSLGPTLPLAFFLYWIPYSLYALIQTIGFHDIFLPLHAAGIVEAIFIKLLPIVSDSFLFAILLRLKPGGKTFVWASFYFLNPLAIFDSSVRGHYDSASLALIILGVYWMKGRRVTRAGLAFVVSGMIQLLGFIPYALLFLHNIWEKNYKSAVALAGVGTIIAIYQPETIMLYRLFLGVSGLTSSQFSSPGRYTLLGLYAPPALASHAYFTLTAGAAILSGAFLSFRKLRPRVETILLYTALSSLTFLLFTNLVAAWLWLVPIGLAYAILKQKNPLGEFILVLGTAVAFVIVAHTTGSAYYLEGSSIYQIQPSIEGARNGITIFAMMTTVLAGLFLVYFRGAGGKDEESTLVTSSLTVLGVYLLIFFWASVFFH